MEKHTQPRINNQIRSKVVRLIDEDGEQLGIVDVSKALNEAQKLSLDLVEISPVANPPVCKIMNWEKFYFDQKKKSKEINKIAKTTKVKTIWLSPVIEKHDLDVKINQAKRFLNKGNKVKFEMFFSDREYSHKEIGLEIFSKITLSLTDQCNIDQAPSEGGRVKKKIKISMLVSPKSSVSV